MELWFLKWLCLVPASQFHCLATRFNLLSVNIIVVQYASFCVNILVLCIWFPLKQKTRVFQVVRSSRSWCEMVDFTAHLRCNWQILKFMVHQLMVKYKYFMTLRCVFSLWRYYSCCYELLRNMKDLLDVYWLENK